MSLSNQIMDFLHSVMEDIQHQQQPQQQQIYNIQQQQQAQFLYQQTPPPLHVELDSKDTSPTTAATILDGATPNTNLKMNQFIDLFQDNVNINNSDSPITNNDNSSSNTTSPIATTTTTSTLEQDLLLVQQQQQQQQTSSSQFNTPTTISSSSSSPSSSIPTSPSNNNLNDNNSNNTDNTGNGNDDIIPKKQQVARITTNNFLEALPQEIVNYIFLKVGANGVKDLMRVNKLCHKTGMNEKLWLYFVEHDFRLEKLEIGQYIKLNGGVRALYSNLYFKKKNSLPRAPSSNPLIQYFFRPISKIPALFSRKEYKALMYGLDGVGKTTMLYKFARGENVRTLHTNGYNVEIVEYKSCDFICWDIGYEKTNVPVWQYYIQDTQAIIFIIDSCDRQRLRLVKEELWNLVNDKNVQKIVNFKQQNNNTNNSNNNSNNKNTDTRVKVLIYSNKTDQISENPMNTLEVAQSLSLYNLPKNISWHVQGCSATSEEGDGLYEGLDWLSSQFDT
ncbi:hypothetical protein CYY_002657 [Polysphondylium violaceum]|uniref:ARF/SAR superfamily protein n=1 Tax=Polysphondylium violaceum TaxID=133409 RepID=A0A8J4PXT0_9MYCE|nr:hypothetical protein CYY_002657 [Polysphondylium violaceum]